MNAIQMLKEDHARVRALLAELEDTTTRATSLRPKLLEDITKEIKIHAKLEEEIFYPAFREAAQGKEDKSYFEALEEHGAVEDLVIPHLAATDPSTEKFAGRAKVLKDMLEHHIKEEETEMFPKAQSLLDATTLKELAERMQARKEELLAQQDSWMGEILNTIHGAAHSVIGMVSAGKRELRAEHTHH